MLSFAMLLMLSFTGFAQQTVTGKVTSSEDGQGIPGVSIMIKGTNKGTTTDGTGSFKIVSSSEKDILGISAIGYVSTEVAIGKRSSINITLAVENQALSEVVVVGYGTQKKSQLTGAISQVSAKQISEMPITNLGQALQGRTAGVDVSQSGSKPGTTPKILIRGRRSLTLETTRSM